MSIMLHLTATFILPALAKKSLPTLLACLPHPSSGPEIIYKDAPRHLHLKSKKIGQDAHTFPIMATFVKKNLPITNKVFL